jgi:hypothetical protein
MSNSNTKSATIASQLGRELDPSIIAALNSQGVNVYGSHSPQATLDPDNEVEERSTDAEIIENNQLDPAKQPIKRLIWAGIPICLLVGIISFFMFGGSSKNQVASLDPVASKPQPQKDDRDKKIEELQQKMAADNQKRDMEAMNSKPSPSPTTSPAVTPSPAPIVQKATPTPTPTPQIIYKTNTVYKTLPAPRPVPIPGSKTPSNTQTVTRPAIIANATPKTPPPSFIPLGGAGMVQNRPIRPTRTAIRTKRTPLASENVLLGTTTGATKMTVGTIVPGTTVTGHLLSPMQSNSGNGNQGTTAIKVALDQPLRTNGGYQLPTGTVVSFAATINPQNGAVSAISGDAWNNGKVISIPPGAISIQSANNQPLIATAFAPKTGDLAKADINNALLGAGGEIGNELTKGSSSINVGNGSTIIQNSSNPNILGAVLKGGFQTWATDQRQRTQTSASQILSAPPIQYLAQNTPVKLTVNSPATIRVAQ